jgi:uncharacterized protein (UPF0332 family)
LIDNDKLEEAVSLAYYSMYHSVIALLFKVGIKSENHTGSIMLLIELFGLDNSKIQNAKKERIDKQYYVDFSINKLEVEETIKDAEDFNSKIYDFIEKLTNDKKEEFRERFVDLR